MNEILTKISTKEPYNYRGIVVNNVDPDNFGRIQVRIYPMFSGVSDALLPWAVPAMPIFCGSGDASGYLSIPAIGSWVFCCFEMGEVTQPIYWAEAPTATKGLPTGHGTNITIWRNDKVAVIIDKSTGNITITNEGDITITNQGKTVLTSTGVINITGSEITLN